MTSQTCLKSKCKLLIQVLFITQWEADLYSCFQVGITLMCISTQAIFNRHIQRERGLLFIHSFSECGCLFMIHNSLRTQQCMEEFWPVSLKLKFQRSTALSLKTLGCLEE